MDNNSWTRLRSVGQGSFGAVSLARLTPSGGLFAVKSVDLNSAPLPAVISLDNEIQVLGSLKSPYIISYLGHDTTQQSSSATFRNLHIEYMPGGTAADTVPMDEKLVRDYTLCITHALHYLHSTVGIVHGDVKGRNILLGSEPGVAKLADFGTAKRVGGDSATVSGTPLWMAPEVARGEGTTPSSDIWSLGCTVIEMAGGTPPWSSFSAEDVAGMMVRIGFGDRVPEFPPGMSEATKDFVEKCLRRDAGERWSCRELLQHPFLAGAHGSKGDFSGTSPRSVLDGVNLESETDDSDEDDDKEDREQAIASAWERIKGLGLEGGVVNWESEGWEDVRGTEQYLDTVELEETRLGGRWRDALFLHCFLNLIDSLLCNDNSSQ